MKNYVAQRLGIAVLTLLGMSMVIFVLLRLAPGDIVDILFSTGGYVDPEARRTIMRELGILDRVRTLLGESAINTAAYDRAVRDDQQGEPGT